MPFEGSHDRQNGILPPMPAHHLHTHREARAANLHLARGLIRDVSCRAVALFPWLHPGSRYYAGWHT